MEHRVGKRYVTKDRLLKPSEVCDMLAIDNRTMHQWIRQGRLIGVKLGPKSMRVYKSSVDALIND